MDISIILNDWPYDEHEDANNIRKVAGIDGKQKLQLRLKSGIIQWELEGRPDGTRPHGFPSMVSYCEHLLRRSLETLPDSDEPPFRLSRDLLQEIEAEMVGFYERRLALFKIADYKRAHDDAEHSLRALELVRKYSAGPKEYSRYDRHRPHILLDKARAAALFYVKQDLPEKAIDALNTGIAEIKDFHREYDWEDRIPDSEEIQILMNSRRSLREKYGSSLTDEELLDTLQAEQEVAIRNEDYETAARIRDKISSVKERLRECHR